MHILSAEHASSNADLHGAIHVLEPLCTFGSGREKDALFFGHLFYIPLVEIPPKREHHGAELYSYFYFHHLWPC